MSEEQEVRQLKRQRAIMLKSVRQGHEKQLHRMDDFEMWCQMQDLGMHMSQNQVVTMLQDLAVFGYIKFDQSFSDQRERVVLTEIELTAMGTAITVRRQSNEEVLFG